MLEVRVLNFDSILFQDEIAQVRGNLYEARSLVHRIFAFLDGCGFNAASPLFILFGLY